MRAVTEFFVFPLARGMRGTGAALALVLVLLPTCASVYAESLTSLDSAINSVSDIELKKCLISLRKSNQWKNIDDVKSIKCHSKKISSLSGLSVFYKLETLSLHNNQLSTFDCSPYPNLQVLNLAKNRLSSFKCHNLNQLQKLFLFANELQDLTLANLANLETLKANNNQIEKFEHENLAALKKIYLFNNIMEHMEISGLPALNYMDVRENPMPDKLYEDMDKLTGVTVLHDGNAEDWN